MKWCHENKNGTLFADLGISVLIIASTLAVNLMVIEPRFVTYLLNNPTEEWSYDDYKIK